MSKVVDGLIDHNKTDRTIHRNRSLFESAEQTLTLHERDTPAPKEQTLGLDQQDISVPEDQTLGLDQGDISAQSAVQDEIAKPTATSSSNVSTEPKSEKSYLISACSFCKSSETPDEVQPTLLTKVSDKKEIPTVSGSRYFYSKDNSLDRKSAGRFVRQADQEEQLNRKGISTFSIISPIVHSVTGNDDVGGQVLEQSYNTIEHAYTVHNTVSEHSTKSLAAQKKVSTVANTATASVNVSTTTATVSESGSVATASSGNIFFVFVFVGLLLTAILFMLFSLMSIATTQIPSFDEEEIGAIAYIDKDTKNNKDLVLWCLNAADREWGYVYGAYGQTCTEDFLSQQARRYPADDEAGGPMKELGRKWLGKPVVDCIGLIKSYAWFNVDERTIEYGYKGFRDCGANSIWYIVVESGDISTMPDIPGLAVWQDGHIGVYVGDSYVVEAQGTATGVIKSRLRSGSWKKWLKIPNIEYLEESEATDPTGRS